MTDRDLMPFGKYKGKPMGEVPKEYLQWLLKQEGFADKNKSMAAYIRGDPDAATEKEKDNIQAEEGILRGMSESFKTWWNIAYGDRLRKDGEMLYIPYLRVAKEAWLHCEGIYMSAQKNPAPSPAYVPPPPPKPINKDNRDEEVNF